MNPSSQQQNYDYLWKRLMSASILVLISRIISSIPNIHAILKPNNILLLFTVVSFFLFFLRIFWGDSNFNNISLELGLNTIYHSKNFFLRNKKIIDGIMLSIQSCGFLILAYNIEKPKAYFQIYHDVINVNIIWLSYQVYCFVCYIYCIIKKHLQELKLSSKEFFNKARRVIRLFFITNVWLLNNIFFSLLATLCYSPEMNCYFILALTIVNSLFDIVLSGRFYSRPDHFILGE